MKQKFLTFFSGGMVGAGIGIWCEYISPSKSSEIYWIIGVFLIVSILTFLLEEKKTEIKDDNKTK